MTSLAPEYYIKKMIGNYDMIFENYFNKAFAKAFCVTFISLWESYPLLLLVIKIGADNSMSGLSWKTIECVKHETISIKNFT